MEAHFPESRDPVRIDGACLRYDPPRLRRLAWSIGIISIVLMLGGLVLMFVDRNAQIRPDLRTWTLQDAAQAISNIAVPLIGMLLAVRRPRNPIGWLFLVAGVALALSTPMHQYAIHALRVDRGSLPAPLFAAWISNWMWPIPSALLIFLLLLFPDGHLRSPRWRWAAWSTAICSGLLVLSILALATGNWTHPFPISLENSSRTATTAWQASLFVGLVVYPVLLVAAFVSLVMRFRSSSGEERLQLKWFVTAAGAVAFGNALSITGLISTTALSVASTIGLLFLYAAIAVAVLKYRLYEIDVIISKAVVYGILGAFITVVYLVVVVVVGAAVGTTEVLSLVATAIVAIAFQPMRLRARSVANRVVYGERATPYEVLSEFAERAAGTYSTDDVLPRLVQVLAQGIGATEARVWLRVGTELRAAAAWPDPDVVATRPLAAGELPAFPEPERAFPVRYGGDLLGAISVVMPASEPLRPDRENLIEGVAAQTGLVLRNVRLIEELRESRRRIVTAQDERAKTLERNLHDGAQQQLVALAVKQRLAETLIDRDPAKAKALLADIQTETQDALETLRDLARGIYPPLLADKGLGAALTAQARKAALPVEVRADGVGRYPQEVEAAVYFCCLEALQNVAKYANASRATIDLWADERGLRFEVADDGAGFDPGKTAFGSGLQGMADRLDAIRGTLDVRSSPGGGTTVVGTVAT